MNGKCWEGLIGFARNLLKLLVKNIYEECEAMRSQSGKIDEDYQTR